MSLSAPRVTALTVVEGPQRLWWEWLSSYFDGQTHAVAGESILFPQAEISFGTTWKSSLPSLEIRVLQELQRQREFLAEPEELMANRVKQVMDTMTWRFVVRASVVRTSEGNSKHLCRQMLELLRGLFEDPDVIYPLAQKGMVHLAAGRDTLIPTPHCTTRELFVQGELHYPVLVASGPLVLVNGELLLQSNNGTWHWVRLVQVGAVPNDKAHCFVDPAASTPPVFAAPYLVLQGSDGNYPVKLEQLPNGTTHLSIGKYRTNETGLSSVTLKSSDGSDHVVTLVAVNGKQHLKVEG